ncbi:MAG: hypothetical protein KDD94_02745, partial [Calditrichaeota bacterium]|nr:hypothetical protein [Calditrichota bacterium]
IYYSENVQKRLTIPFHIVVNRLFKLDDHEIPKSKKSIYMYIFIKKDSHKPLILEGPSTDAGILQQISEYFGNSVIKTE